VVPGRPSRIRSIATVQTRPIAALKMSDSDGKVGITTMPVIPLTHRPTASDEMLSFCSICLAAVSSRL
jgi:hypothetical protein